MRLHIFQSDKGDCLLLESRDGKNRILCDGGMARSMKAHVRDELGKLRKAGKKLDFIYVSHIDSDHISGVLQLLQDELEWRIHEQRSANGHKEPKKPANPRPPEIGGIWHNAFADQLGPHADSVANAIQAHAPVFLGTRVPHLVEAGEELAHIATSVPEAIKVSRLASAELLDIQVNLLPGRTKPTKLISLSNTSGSFNVGSMQLTVIGPGKKELDLLKEGWSNWLRDNEEATAKIRDQLRKRIEELGSEAVETSLFDLSNWNGVPGRDKVTVPNIASLMLMVEEGSKRLLLTGDSHHDIILEGLRKTGFLAPGHIHLDALKVQHHGSENNMSDEFCRQVSADHYVFCGNGEHSNPDVSVIQKIHDSRLGPNSKRALAPQANGKPFTFWFSTSSKVLSPGSNGRADFVKAEKLVARLVAASGGALAARYNTGNVHALKL